MDIEHKLKSWSKQVLFGGAFSENREVRDAVLFYLLRSLSRGRIPDMPTAMETLREERPVPPCGWLNCLMNDADHVH